MKNVSEIVEKIKSKLSIGGSHYFNVEIGDTTVKIRVSDHSANREVTIYLLDQTITSTTK